MSDFSGPDKPLLDIRGLNLFFHDSADPVQILSDVNLQIAEGEVFGVVGESGCGKSLTALSVLRLLPHGARLDGRILFRNRDLLSLSEEEMQKIRGRDIAMVFQEPMTALNPVFTIGKQVSEVLIHHEGLSKREALERSVELLRSVHIPQPEIRLKDYPHKLSGGMRQRVMIAMAIACNPRLLIADEPTTALDVTIQAEILDLLMEIKKQTGMSVMLISHDLGIISETAASMVVMYAGRIVEFIRVGELIDKAAHPYTMGLIESLPIKRGVRLNPIPGTVPSAAEMPPGCKFVPRCRYVIPLCNEREPELREVDDNHLVRCFRAEELKGNIRI